MTTKAHFSSDALATLNKSQGLRIRAGSGTHRFIGIWAVVVKDRLFVRSWSLTPGGWYRTFLEERSGAIQLANREIPVRAVHTRAESVLKAIDRAYLSKYSAPGSLKYANDLVSGKCRSATLELAPLPAGKS